MIKKKKLSGVETPIQYIKGIGPKRSAVLQQFGINTVRDLLYFFPRNYLDLSRVEKIGNIRKVINTNQYVTLIGTVRTFDVVGRYPNERVIVVLGDDTDTIQLVFFQSLQYYKKAFKVGEKLAVSGKVTEFMNRPQMIHPSIDRLSEDNDNRGKKNFLHTSGLVPQYSSTEELKRVGLETRGFRKILRNVLDHHLEGLTEFLPQSISQRHNFLKLTEALKQIHFPRSHELLNEARRRLKFDELFIMQLLLALRRQSIKVELPGISFRIESKLARNLANKLPFKLTQSQIKVINEIANDMKSQKPMNRLLQGDVGSGKTIVALLAMLVAVDNGYQAAFMAPTEILAEQHFKTLKNFLNNLPVNIRLLISGQSKHLREEILKDIQTGTANIIVGTHALIQEGVQFLRLGLVVIDEQHRFGVYQRLALKQKAVASQDNMIHPDVLVMTATPIPRTLALTLYGDLDISIIKEMPANRKPIRTIMIPESKREQLYQFIRKEIKNGRQVYIVYPLIETSEKIDLKAATDGYELLAQKIFPEFQVGLLHGKMQADKKDEIMEMFKSNKINILVSTTVIEVGIDIPNATVMVIEHSERFGLSQLHQLRGRVGRGSEQSYCFLVVPDWIGQAIDRSAKSKPTNSRPFDNLDVINEEQDEKQKVVKRISTMLETTDGFKIAEVDLELRGPGDFFGKRQSGLPELQLANLLIDKDILTIARKEAFNLIESDPHLRKEEHRALREYFLEQKKDALSLIEVG